jgi:hypothetical protein
MGGLLLERLKSDFKGVLNPCLGSIALKKGLYRRPATVLLV